MVHPDDFHHGFTFSGHPRGVRRRSENLEIIEQKKLVPGVKEFTGPAVAKMLAKLKYHPLVGEVRSIGLLGAIELVADKRARRCFAALGRVGLICRDHFFRDGLIMRHVFDTIVTASPLIWRREQFDEAEVLIRRRLEPTLNDVTGELAA